MIRFSGIHDFVIHSYGQTKTFITVHVEVDSKVDVLKSHDLMDVIETEVGLKRNMLITIHMDPIQTDSEEINELKKFTRQILDEMNKSLSFHDFRIVKGDTHTNVLFDVVLPYDVKLTEDEIKQKLNAEYKKINPYYFLVIKIDRVYIGD